VSGNSLDVSCGVMIRLVPQTAGFEAIKDFFKEAPVGVRFTQH
jgi:hypothetical protein